MPTDGPSIISTLKMLDGIQQQAKTCIVAFSGGKDSWAVLELCHRVFGTGNVHAYNLFIVPELETELRELRRVERRYGITVRRYPHPALYAALSQGHLLPLPTGFNRQLHHAAIYRLVRDVTKSDWLMFGHRMDESLQRRGMIRSSEGVMTNLRKCYPLWNWHAGDVFRFLKSAKIQIPEQWTEDDTTGMTLGPQTLLYLRRHHPADYRKVIEMFPLAEAQFLREQQRLESGLEPTHFSIRRKSGLMDELHDYHRQAEGQKQQAETAEALAQ